MQILDGEERGWRGDDALMSRARCSATSAFTRVFDALWRCSAEPGSTFSIKLRKWARIRSAPLKGRSAASGARERDGNTVVSRNPQARDFPLLRLGAGGIFIS